MGCQLPLMLRFRRYESAGLGRRSVSVQDLITSSV